MDKMNEILKQNIDFKEKLKKICSEIFNEEVSIYQVKELDVITYEVHFNDDNFYEIDLPVDASFDQLSNLVINNLILERNMDIKFPNMNRNNVRYFKRDNI